MTPDELRDKLVTTIVDIITAHQLPDYGHICRECKARLYSEGKGSSLSRHRAEKIVDDLDLVEIMMTLEKEHGTK